MRALLLVALLASIAYAQFEVSTFYASSSCTGGAVGIYAAAIPASDCSAISCVAGSTAGEGYTVTCPSSLPSPPPDAITIATYETSGCAGNPTAFISLAEGECNSAGSVSYELVCAGGQATYNLYQQAGCKGTPTAVNYQDQSGCISESGVSVSITGCGGSSSSKCFHEDTVITYNNEQLTLPALLAGTVPACVVPHVKRSDGVAIHTACSAQALRLTPEHLVYSARGLLLASELRVGDSLFADVNEQAVCNVTSIDAEARQRYFGLNCEDSVVLANGIKTSAFGVYHTVPTAWMKIASSLVGVKRASAIGDQIAAFLYDWSLV